MFIFKSNVHIKKKYMFFLIFLIFLYILFCNSIGLIPYTFTITSSLVVTFFVSAMFFLGVNIIGIFTNG
jgi:F-type H+-transporting ATPase subunit a